jgi:hypothetical protein
LTLQLPDEAKSRPLDFSETVKIQASKPKKKETSMTTTSNKDTDILREGLKRTAAMMESQTEQAIVLAKANFEHIAHKSREAMEQSIQTANFLAIMTRGNVDALLASSRVATGSLQSMANEVADYSKTTLERTTAAARALQQAKSATELMELQSAFARTEFTNAISEVLKLSEAMFQTMTAVFEPLQKQAVESLAMKQLPS